MAAGLTSGMGGEAAFLLALREGATPALDRFFLLSHHLGTLWFCAALVIAMVAWHGLRGEGRAATTWLAAGVAALVVQEGLKRMVGRPRPDLWPRLESWSPLPGPGPESLSFPSGHALASAALYPLLGYVLTRGRSPSVRASGVGAGVAVALWIGFGRMYLGVHWPTDVLAGWALGALLATWAIRGLR